MVRVLLGYTLMVISSAATFVVIVAVGFIYNTKPLSFGSIFFAFFNPFSIIGFMAAASFAAIYSSIPFAVFITIGEIKKIRCIEWYLLAALMTLGLFFSIPLLDNGSLTHNSNYIFSDKNIKQFDYIAQSLKSLLDFASVVMQAVAGTFVYWKFSGKYAGTKDEQMYGPF